MTSSYRLLTDEADGRLRRPQLIGNVDVQKHMTIRTLLNKKKRTVSIIAFTGFLIFFAGTIFGAGKNELLVIGIIGFGVAFITLLYAYFGIRCPKCEGRWGYIAMYLGHRFAIHKKIRFWPYCEVELDQELTNSNNI